MKTITGKKTAAFFSVLAVCSMLVGATAKEARAASAREIDTSVDATLDRFYGEVKDGKKLVQDAKGVLVFPAVYKVGFGIGGEYGEGALRINGTTVDYYNTIAGSFGFQIGAQKKSVILLFMQDGVLSELRQSSNWKAGAGASITLITLGADGSVDTQKLNEPILAFVIGQKGLMYNLSLEGTKFTKLNKSS
jgi:lipid-binding SYLF domain-containing protein